MNKGPWEPSERRARGSSKGIHPLWSGNPTQLVKDRRWRESIPQASDNPNGIFPPVYSHGISGVSMVKSLTR
jgi:hypothetical protein